MTKVKEGNKTKYFLKNRSTYADRGYDAYYLKIPGYAPT